MNSKKLSPIFIILLFTLLLGINSAEAVPASVKAKSEYLLADKLFNNGDFAGAIEHAEKSLAILGNTNSRIQYLLTKAYVATDQPDLAFAAIESFFEVTPESMSGTDQYNEMVEQYSIIEESVINLREFEKEEKKSQDIKYCKAICHADLMSLYWPKYHACHAEAVKKNKSAGEGVAEVFEVLTLGIADTGSTVDELAKPCVQNYWDDYLAKFPICTGSCQEEEFRQSKRQDTVSTNPLPLILGESKVLGYQYNYEDLTIWITAVSPDSPCKIAGFAKHDYIVAVDGNPIESGTFVNDIRDKVISGEIESAVLDIRRGGRKMEYLLTK